MSDKIDSRLIEMVRREMLSTMMLTHTLLQFATHNRSEVGSLVSVVTPRELECVYDMLQMYPFTEVGWSILPDSRKAFLKPGLNR